MGGRVPILSFLLILVSPVALGTDVDGCRWVSRVFVESFCAQVDARPPRGGIHFNRENQSTFGTCVGEFVCPRSWSREVAGREVRMEPGVYPVHCPARTEGDRRTCGGVSVETCVNAHRSPAAVGVAELPRLEHRITGPVFQPRPHLGEGFAP